ncbi:DUF6247 family protein [Sphaerisporangium dianthi]|uniref:DUF6247 family protein n=1 Tax=Sphaerisporangium dianthi TaxID=1436120 RepID=A0ABV9CEQ4_9ACTN
MSAQPVHQEDPHDPEVILRDLPQREREEFLRQYQAAVDAVREPSGYRELQRLLRHWTLVVVAADQPDYYEELEAVKNGTARTVPIEAAVPGWEERVAVARAARR